MIEVTRKPEDPAVGDQDINLPSKLSKSVDGLEYYRGRGSEIQSSLPPVKPKQHQPKPIHDVHPQP